MKMTRGWMRATAVAAVMVAAGVAGAQTTTEDAAKAAELQAQQAAAQAADAQTQAAKIEADVQAHSAERQAEVEAQAAKMSADIQARMADRQAEVEAQSAKITADVQARMADRVRIDARVQADIQARVQAQVARQLQVQTQMAPMEAKLEMMLGPMQAEMLARSAAMQAHMMVRGLALQDGMVSVGDPQVKDDLFDGTEKFAKGASDVTSVNLGPDMLGMVSGKHGGAMAHKLNFMVVRTYEYPRAGMYNPADLEVYRQKLRDGKWNCFIHTTDSRAGESTDICNRALPDNQGNEMVIMTVEPKELTFIHMSGKGSLSDLSKLGRMGGMGGVISDEPDTPDPPAPPPAVNPHQ